MFKTRLGPVGWEHIKTRLGPVGWDHVKNKAGPCRVGLFSYQGLVMQGGIMFKP